MRFSFSGGGVGSLEAWFYKGLIITIRPAIGLRG